MCVLSACVQGIQLRLTRVCCVHVTSVHQLGGTVQSRSFPRAVHPPLTCCYIISDYSAPLSSSAWSLQERMVLTLSLVLTSLCVPRDSFRKISKGGQKHVRRHLGGGRAYSGQYSI